MAGLRPLSGINKTGNHEKKTQANIISEATKAANPAFIFAWK